MTRIAPTPRLTHRALLRTALVDGVLPILERAGFTRIPSVRQLVHAFPFGTFGRAMVGGDHLVQIQFDKRGAARCRLNFGVCPPGGVEFAHVRIAADDPELSPQWVPESCELLPHPRLWMLWFGLGVFPRDPRLRAEMQALLVPERLTQPVRLVA